MASSLSTGVAAIGDKAKELLDSITAVYFLAQGMPKTTEYEGKYTRATDGAPEEPADEEADRGEDAEPPGAAESFLQFDDYDEPSETAEADAQAQEAVDSAEVQGEQAEDKADEAQDVADTQDAQADDPAPADAKADAKAD